MNGSLAAFLTLAAVVIMTPGQDTVLTVRNAVVGGKAAGIATALGVALGQSCWTFAASVGLTALLMTSEPAFLALKLIGAGYLVWLGVCVLNAAVRGDNPGIAADNGVRLAVRRSRAFRQGLLSNLGNVKMAVFFSSLLPQFVQPGRTALVTMTALGVVFAALTLIWLSIYSLLAAGVNELLRSSWAGRVINAASGAVLIALGVRLAIESE